MKRAKLALRRETIRHLESAELARIAGGADSGAGTCSCPGTPTVGPCTTYNGCTLHTCNCGSGSGSTFTGPSLTNPPSVM